MFKIDQLEVNLSRIADAEFQYPLVHGPSPITKVLLDIQKTFGGLNSMGPSRDRIVEAVQIFRRTGKLLMLHQLIFCCHGIATRYDHDESCLIEELELFPLLMRRVDGIKKEPQKFRRCFQGLLKGYFVYPGFEKPADSIGHKYWNRLVRQLSEWLPLLEGGELAQRWIGTLRNHQNLLGAAPCQRYGQSLLVGNTDEFDNMCEKLCLNEETWVPRMALLGQLDAAANFRDPEFKNSINILLKKLSEYQRTNKFQMLVEQGIAILLTRYSKCATHPEHKELGERSVALWGTPLMEINSARWNAQVHPSVRIMVKGWMKREAIKYFFELLTGDGTTDPRRLMFWLRYADNIDEMAFALGKDARLNRSSDFVKFREKYKGNWMRLEGSTAGNNAFLMHIGRYLVVALGEIGNALYIYDQDDFPSIYSRSFIERADLMRQDLAIKRLIHRDGRERWEDKFAREIYELVRIFPGK